VFFYAIPNQAALLYHPELPVRAQTPIPAIIMLKLQISFPVWLLLTFLSIGCCVTSFQQAQAAAVTDPNEGNHGICFLKRPQAASELLSSVFINIFVC